MEASEYLTVKCSSMTAWDLQIKSMSTSKSRMTQSFDYGRVRVFKSSVFANQTDRHLTRQIVRPRRSQYTVGVDYTATASIDAGWTDNKHAS